eukprot:12831023-Ditylum_brightwellii.AAC.1
MTISQWLKRVKAINKMLPYLNPSGTKMTITNVNKYVILENISRKMAVAYISQGGKRLAKSEGIKKKLEELEEANKLEKKISALQENKWTRFKKGNDDGKKGSNAKRKAQAGSNTNKKGGRLKKSSDKCHLTGHDHKWDTCENNPKSDNYKGTHYKDMWKKHNNRKEFKMTKM